MARPPRADQAFGTYHVLNRGNLRAAFFHKDSDFLAFETLLMEGLSRYQVQLFSYVLMPNHYHLVLRPLADGEMSRFMKWVGGTHTMRYHAHYGTGGLGHIYQQRFKSFPVQDDGHFLVVCRYVERNPLRAGLVHHAEDWRWSSLWHWLNARDEERKLLSPWPVSRSPDWKGRVNQSLTVREIDAIRHCVEKGTPFGERSWVDQIAEKTGLRSTLRPRGRPGKSVRSQNEHEN